MASKKNNRKSRKQRRPRRKFTPEFRADVVELCRSGCESIAEVSQRLDLTESAVRLWVAKAEATVAVASTTSTVTANEQEELQRLRRENKQLRMERKILKKAPPSSPRKTHEV